ncbi:MAG: formate dehydrogenase, partial [Mycobacterium sp.]|nr:formate dehydrogenase [Mycobacterium sp.]
MSDTIHVAPQPDRARSNEPTWPSLSKGTIIAKVVCVLYDDPIDGYPTQYARDTLPKLDGYPGGQT